MPFFFSLLIVCYGFKINWFAHTVRSSSQLFKSAFKLPNKSNAFSLPASVFRGIHPKTTSKIVSVWSSVRIDRRTARSGQMTVHVRSLRCLALSDCCIMLISFCREANTFWAFWYAKIIVLNCVIAQRCECDKKRRTVEMIFLSSAEERRTERRWRKEQSWRRRRDQAR